MVFVCTLLLTAAPSLTKQFLDPCFKISQRTSIEYKDENGWELSLRFLSLQSLVDTCAITYHKQSAFSHNRVRVD